jgi:ubiquinone/menaquinone biosynthesis C-methylase UbiE
MRANLPVSCTPDNYDRYTAIGVGTYDRLMIDRIKEEFHRLGRPEARIVDACTGTGRLLLRVAAIPALARSSFFAFDLFEEMILIARKNIDESKLAHRIRADVADIHNLPYDDGFADMIFARSVVHHWGDPVRAFKELQRILAPCGVAVIHEPRRDPAPEAYAVAQQGRRHAGIRPVTLQEKYTADEVREQLKQAGILKFDVFDSDSGPEAIGFEVRFERRTPSNMR